MSLKDDDAMTDNPTTDAELSVEWLIDHANSLEKFYTERGGQCTSAPKLREISKLLTALLSTIEGMRAALEFYADENSWSPLHPLANDRGYRAREALTAYCGGGLPQPISDEHCRECCDWRRTHNYLTETTASPSPTTEQWTCFHCGETFTTRETAHAHFGDSEIADAACRLNAEEGGIAAKLRDAEHELRRYAVEDSDMDRKFYAMTADHQVALRRAEEDGYGKGVRDASPTTEHQRALEEALLAVNEEPELTGDMPPELHLVPIGDALRATVRATKKGIFARIRALATAGKE